MNSKKNDNKIKTKETEWKTISRVSFFRWLMPFFFLLLCYQFCFLWPFLKCDSLGIYFLHPTTLNLFNLPNEKWNNSPVKCWTLHFSCDSHHTQKTIQIIRPTQNWKLFANNKKGKRRRKKRLCLIFQCKKKFVLLDWLLDERLFER